MTGPLTVGWKEYADLPGVGLTRLKVKMDTGARTSALHVNEFSVEGDEVAFTVVGHRSDESLEARAPLVGWVDVRNSGGSETGRPLVRTPLRLGTRQAEILVTLADRRGMLFRMLIGRKALESLGVVVDVSQKYMLGRRRPRRQ